MPPKTKDPKDFKLVGTSVHRLDIPAKVTGTFTYMQDFRVPDMLHGRVVRPPAIGAKLESVDEASISDIPGVVKSFAKATSSALWPKMNGPRSKAAQKLKATWSQWEGLPEKSKLFDYVRATKVAKDEVTGNAGNYCRGHGQRLALRSSARLMILPSIRTVPSVRPARLPNSRMAN